MRLDGDFAPAINKSTYDERRSHITNKTDWQYHGFFMEPFFILLLRYFY